MAFRNISVIITANASQLVGAYAQAAAATEGFAARAAASAESVAALGVATTSQSRRLGTLATASLDAAVGLELLGRASAAAGASSAMAGYQAAAAEINAMAVAAGRATAELTTLAAASGAAGAAAAAGGAQGAAGAAAASAGAGRLAATAAQAERTVGTLGAAAGVAGSRMATVGATATTAAAGAQRLGMSSQFAGQVGLAALAVGLVASVAGAIQFEAAMTNVATIDEKVRANFDATSAAVLNMSKNVPQSAQTLAQGLYTIAGSGIYGASAMGVLDVSARAASAGLTTTGTASKAIVASLNAYGLVTNDAATTTANATRVSDALFNTVNYGVISFEALTAAVANSVGNASKAGVSIEELGSAMATMTLSGLSASNAGVALNNMISKLVKPSKALQAEFSKLHINIEQDLRDPAKGLHWVMSQLQADWDGNLSSILKWFPEIRAARGVMSLFAADGDTYNRVFGQMGTVQDNAGATARVFGQQMQTTKAQLSIFKNEIAATGIELGAALLPALNGGMRALESFGGVLKGLGSQLVSGLAPGFRDLGRALSDLWAIVQDLQLDDLAAGLAKLGIGTVVVSFRALAAIIAALTGFLRDNETVVIALGVAYAALKAEAVASAIATLALRFAELAVAMQVNAILAWRAAVATVGAAAAEVAVAVTRMRTAYQLATAFGQGPMLASVTALSNGMVAMRGSMLASVGTLGLYAAAFAAAVISIKSIVDAGHEAANVAKQIEANMNPGSIRAYGDEWETLRGKTHGFLDLNWGLLGGLPAMLLENANANRGYGNELDKVSEKQKTFIANADRLAAGFGVTRQQVLDLAEANRVDLSQALDKADASGKTAAQTLGTMLAPIQSAKLSSKDLGTVLNAMGTSADEAKVALDGLNAVFDTLSGKAIDAKTAASQWNIELLKLASGESLATDAAGKHTASLDLNTIAGNQNQIMLLGLIKQNQANAQAQYDSVAATGDLDGATDAYWKTLDGGLVGLRTAATQAGLTAGEFDKLTESVNSQPDTVEIAVSTPGAAESVVALDKVGRQADRLDLEARVQVSAPGAELTAGQLDSVGLAAGGLPPSVAVPTSTPGAVQSKTELDSVGLAAGGLPPSVAVPTSTPGAVNSKAEVDALLVSLGLMPASKDSNIATPGAVQGKSEVDALREAIGMLHDKTITVTTIQYEIIQRAYDNASNPSAASATRRAYGGPIFGPGGPTDDRVPIMASPGEYMIRASSAQSYGYAAMSAVNAGTAQISGYAAGGPVGPVWPKYAAGGAVSGGGGGVSIFAPITIDARGSVTPAPALRTAVEQALDAKLGRVVHSIRAGAGRGRG